MWQDESRAGRVPPGSGPSRGPGQARGLDTDGPPRTPRWVKVSAVIAVVVLLVLGSVLVFGGGDHGPGRHAPIHGETEPGQSRKAYGPGGSGDSAAIAAEANARDMATRAAPVGL